MGPASTANHSAATRSIASRPTGHLAWLLWLLLALIPWSSCGGEQTVLVTALGADAETASFVVSARIDGERILDGLRFPASPAFFHLTIPSGRTGRLEVVLDALDGERCSRAQGRGTVLLPSSDPATIDVFLVQQPFATCALQVELPTAMHSQVLSQNGELRCEGSCVRQVQKGTSISLRVEQADGEHFLGFRSPCTGTEPCQLVMSRPTTVQLDVTKVEICSPDRVCWERPSPQGQTLHGLWAASPRDVWAVGDNGAVLHFDGTTWVGRPAPSHDTLHGLFGLAPDQAWAVGDGGTILRYDGQSWTKAESPTKDGLRAVWASSGSDVWAVGENGAIVHYDGKTWQLQSVSTTIAFSAVFGTSPRDIWAMGYGNQAFHYDGQTWRPVTLGSSLLVSSIWGATASDLWAVGYDYGSRAGVILHGDGHNWIRYFTTSGPRLAAVFGSALGSTFALGEQGLILRFVAGRWETLPAPTQNRLLAGIALTTQQALAVGEGGTTLRWDGASWQQSSSSETTNLHALASVGSSELWLVGESGRIWHGYRGSYASLPSTTTDPLRGVWAASTDDVWIVGDFGTILHLGRQQIDLVPSSVSTDLRGVYGFGAKDIWMVGRSGVLLHYDGQGLSRVETGLTQALNAIGGSSASDVWAVGDQGVILHTVGGEWRRSWSRTGDTLRAVWAASPSDVWIVGDNGVIIRYLGGAYEYDFVGDEHNPITLLGIVGQPGGEVIAVGQGGHMFRFDGKAWNPIDSGTGGALTAAARDAEGRYWFTGQGGAILRRDPRPGR